MTECCKITSVTIDAAIDRWSKTTIIAIITKAISKSWLYKILERDVTLQ